MELNARFDVKKLAAVLGVHPKTVYRWTESDPPRIPHLRLGRLIRFEASVIRQWLEGHSRHAR